MVVLKYAVGDVYTAFAGGTAVINQMNNLGTLIVPDNATAFIVYVKAYNNQYTSWEDSYYSDANLVTSTSIVNIQNKAVTVTVQGSSSATITWE